MSVPFVLTVDDAVHRLDPEARIDLGPLLALYPASLSAAYVSAGAALHLDFDSGARLSFLRTLSTKRGKSTMTDGSLYAFLKRPVICVPETAGDIAEWAHP